MTVGRIKSFPYPERVDSIKDMGEYLKSLYRSLTEDQVERITDFENMSVASLEINDVTIVANIGDGTNTLTVANAKDAYDKRVDTWGDGLQYSSQTASVDYNTTNLKITSTEIDTIQGISSAAQVQFASLGLGTASATNALQISATGTTAGWGGAYGGVVARIHCTESKHTSVCIDALTDYDGVLAFSENGSAMWDIRNDASATDTFNIRYQVGAANATYLAINNAGKIGVGTAVIPHGTTGYAKFAIEGTDSSVDGPHIQYTTATNDYPLFQQLNWAHDNIALTLDAYYDGGWKSSDAGSNFQIRKYADTLYLSWDNTISAGSAVTWNTALTLDTSGNFDFQSGNLVTLGTFGCAALTATGTVTIPTALTGVIRADSGVLSVEATAVLDADFGSAGLCATDGAGTYSIVSDASANWNTAFGWGDHAGGGYAAASHAMSTHSDEDTYTLATTGSITSSGTGGVTSGDASNAGSIIIYDGSNNKQTISTGALAGDITFILPTTDGDASQYLQTNGSGTLTWATVTVADEKVKVDSGATADYLGAASNDGVLRVGSTITYTDGGSFVTLAVNPVLDITELLNSGGDLKIMPDVQGDVTLFEDTDIADATDGKALIVHRKAAEFDKYIKTYIDQYGHPRISITQTGGTDLHSLCIGGGANLAAGAEDNVIIGHEAGNSLTTFDRNVLIGYRAGYTVNYPDNVFVGYQAGYSSTTATRNTYLGKEAGYRNTSGDDNVCIGNKAGYGLANADFDFCVLIGYEAGYKSDQESSVIAIGTQAGYELTTGDLPLFVGSSAGKNCTTGNNNVAFGSQSMYHNQTGADNVCIGNEAGRGVEDDSITGCVFIGRSAGRNATGSTNIGVGFSALYQTTGTYNMGVGYNALYWLTSGNRNMALGYSAGELNQTGDYNTYIGVHAGAGTYLKSHDENTFIGYWCADKVTTGSQNTIIGPYGARYIGVGSGNVAFGYKVGENDLAADNQLWIANTNTGTPLVYGEFDNARLNIHGDLNVLDPTSLGAECLSEADFATHAKWDIVGDWDDTGGDAEYIHSGGSGTLTQTSANLATPLVGNSCYLFTYTISGYSNSSFLTHEITTGILGAALRIPLTNGAHSVLLHTKATPGDFVISATSNGTCDFTIDDVSLKQIFGAGIRGGSLSMIERSADPTEPVEGQAIIWMSDGTGKGDDGDILIASKAGGQTNVNTIHDHSAGAAW